MRKLLLTLGAALLVSWTAGAGDAGAVGLSGTEQLPEGEFRNCSGSHAEVTHWSPADGPPATAIADAFMNHGGSLWMALGYDETGFWSAEGSSADACDDCDGLSLVRTDFSGKRTSFSVVDRKLRAQHEGKEPADFRKGIKARLFSLAAKQWPVAKLAHDYTLKLPKYDENGQVVKFTGWMAEVSRKDGFLLRFAPVGLPHMCWCDMTWTAYTLAKPKPKP